MRRVSIVIPVHGQDELTEGCLDAIFAADDPVFELEVVLVDDASPQPSTLAALRRRADGEPRLKLVALEENVGYLRAVNAGVAASTGELLVLLNNDTEPAPGWLRAMAELIDRPGVGLVGARLIDGEGVLQDAGGVVFSDGSAWNLGRGEALEDPRFSFVRDVDYCTAAALMTTRAVWDEVGGFDERYVPAYYEDADFGMAVRAAGYGVLIQPAAVVVHHEGSSHGTDTGSGVKSHQVTNQQVFAEKWATQLASRPPRPPGADATSVRELVMDRIR